MPRGTAPWPYGADAARVAGLIADVVREVACTTPPPRERPYFDLDCLEPLAIPLLAQLTTAGIFRKYEHVLDLATALGGAARWLARSHGCRVVGIARTSSQAIAASLLSTRVNLGDQVQTVAADPASLPVRSEAFTHVWSLDAWECADAWPRFLGEAFRSLRVGGLFAGQEILLGPSSARRDATRSPADELPPDLAARPNATTYAEALTGAGFADVAVRDVTGEHPERQMTYEGARAALLARIAADLGPSSPYLRAVERRAAMATARRRGLFRVYHFLATKPGSRQS
jgi:SAM-dependent methyltransferase